MPSESEHKIEELLKAYAKKRRDQAGASFELTPPTRTLLQAEAARQWSKAAPSESPSFFQLLLRFWPQITLAMSGVLLVGIIVRMLTGPDRHGVQVAFEPRPAASPAAAPQKSELAADSARLKPQEPARARAPMEAKNLDSDFAVLADSYGESAVAAGGPRSYSFGLGMETNTRPGAVDKLGAQAGLAGTAVPGNDLFAKESKLALNSPANQDGMQDRAAFFKQPTSTESEKVLRLSDAPTPAKPDQDALAYSLQKEKQNLARKSELSLNAPVAAPPAPAVQPPNLAKRFESIAQAQSARGDLASKPAGAVAEQFGRTDTTTRSGSERVRFSQITAVAEARGAQPSAGLPPLSSFDVEQNGEQIRIFDADGSVYEGQLTTDAESAPRLAGGSIAEKAKRDLKDVADERLQSGQRAVQLREQFAEHDRPFQAMGTNRSLNRAVVINGRLISAASAESKADAGLTALRQETATAPTTGPAPSAAPAQAPSAPAPAARGMAGALSSTAASATRRALQEPNRPATEQVLRIRGRAKIGGTNELEINAVRSQR